MAGWYDAPVNLASRGEPIEIPTDRVTSNFFAVLGTPTSLGRTFSAGTDLSHVEREVILSYGLWQRRFGGDPSVVGQQIALDGESFTIIGVMPPGFTVRTVELSESRAELWMPFSFVPGDRIGMGGSLNVIARLASQATVPQAQQELSLIARRIEEAHPS
jgi:hypothetical protein